MRVLGIDPGFDRCGVAVAERAPRQKEALLYSQCITTQKKDLFPVRLCAVGTRIEELIDTWHPDAVAFETLFFSTNRKTAMQVAEVRGMLLFIAQQRAIRIYEYSPQAVKIAVTGYGASEKDAVSRMVDRIVRPAWPIAHDDEYDAIAVALTCLAHESHRS